MRHEVKCICIMIYRDLSCPFKEYSGCWNRIQKSHCCAPQTRCKLIHPPQNCTNFFSPLVDVSTFLRSLGPGGNLVPTSVSECARRGCAEVCMCVRGGGGVGGRGGWTMPNVIFNILNKTKRKTRDLHTWQRHGAIWGKRQQASGPVESVTAQPQLRAETHTHSTGSRSPR